MNENQKYAHLRTALGRFVQENEDNFPRYCEECDYHDQPVGHISKLKSLLMEHDTYLILKEKS
ncbi:MAG: hypothetical protein ACOH2T_19000 [Pseudomonas sp.]